MIKYLAKVGNKETMKDGTSYTFWSSLIDTRDDAEDWCMKVIADSKDHDMEIYRYDCHVIEEIEVFHTDNKEEAEREGYKPFWINIWEEAKYVKKWYAKDKDSLQTDWASDEIQDDFSEGQWHWKNGGTDWDIIDAEGEE